MHLCILSDGVPGHVNQSLGLADWLRSTNPTVSCEVLECRLRHKSARPLLAAACNALPRFPKLAQLVLRCYEFKPPARPAGIIVSAGGNTSFANSALAHTWRKPNIFLGSPRRLASENFRALLTLEPTARFPHNRAHNNLVLEFAPARLSDIHPDANTWALLLGGNGSGYRYRPEDWCALLGWARDYAEANSIRWILAGSRRSPAYLRSLCREYLPQELIAHNCWPEDADSPALANLLPRAERVLCTEDSMSMLSEAINLARPLLSLRPRRARPPQRYRQALERYERGQLLRRLPIGQLQSFQPLAGEGRKLREQVSRARQRALDQLLALIVD